MYNEKNEPPCKNSCSNSQGNLRTNRAHAPEKFEFCWGKLR